MKPYRDDEMPEPGGSGIIALLLGIAIGLVVLKAMGWWL